jgi:rSAM/selenodomain-associated transferase 2
LNQVASISGKLPTTTLVIPVYNESDRVEQFISCLETTAGHASQVIIVDGGSSDGTFKLLENRISTSSISNIIFLYQSAPGRARQMNSGAMKNTSDVIVFLHVDTCLPDDGLELISNSIINGAFWGRFDVRLDGDRFIFRIIEYFINLRSALTGIATGDQAIFVRADVFRIASGYPDIPLMEDVAFSSVLREMGPVARIKAPVTTSARRWQSNGIWRTILLMWSLRFLYWLGIKPARLARYYRHTRQA